MSIVTLKNKAQSWRY